LQLIFSKSDKSYSPNGLMQNPEQPMVLLVKYTVNQGIKMQIVLAAQGKFLETMKAYSGGYVLVLPYGVDWTPVIEGDCALEVLLSHPLKRLPIHPLVEL